jgi:predicted  nucleic acid-binding Zn-ribbon protein
MRKLLVMSLLLFTSTFVALVNQAVAADPGTRYADAFILIQQGDVAQKNADSATANQKYTAAIEILRAIRTDAPDWNPQMVEYRLKDVTTRVEGAKPKTPEATAAAPTVEAAAAPAAVVTPAPTPPSTPPSLSVEKPDASATLKADLQHAQDENRRLSAELEEARKATAAPKPSAELETLSKQNKQLSDQLASSQREVTDLQRQTKDLGAQLATAQKQAVKPAVVAAPTESADVKALRSELDAAKKTAARVPELEKQNKDLSAQLAAAGPKQNFGSASHTEAVESDATKKLKEQVASLQKQTKDLSAQLAAAQKEASTKAATAAGESAELNKARAELADARAQADSAKKASARVAGLEKTNKDLATQLAAAQKQASAKAVVPVPVSESPEYKKLRARADDLEKQNKDLSAKLSAAEKQASAKASAPAESAELKKVRTELSDTQAELARAKKAASEKPAAAPEVAKAPAAAASTETGDARIMKQLRRENSYLRNLLEQYAEKNPELKPRLRNLDQGAAPTTAN